jgi:hypothetical protein
MGGHGRWRSISQGCLGAAPVHGVAIEQPAVVEVAAIGTLTQDFLESVEEAHADRLTAGAHGRFV